MLDALFLSRMLYYAFQFSILESHVDQSPLHIFIFYLSFEGCFIQESILSLSLLILYSVKRGGHTGKKIVKVSCTSLLTRKLYSCARNLQEFARNLQLCAIELQIRARNLQIRARKLQIRARNLPRCKRHVCMLH